MKAVTSFVLVSFAVMWVLAVPQKTAKMKQANQTATVGTDKQFAPNAAIGNMTEVQLGNLAQEKASSEFTKQFGAMMVKDHGGALTELKTIASDKNITLPTILDTNSQVAYNKLSAMSGTAFDSAFRTAMIKGHQAAAKLFSNYSSHGKDAELRAYASKYLPAIQRHLQIIQAGHM